MGAADRVTGGKELGRLEQEGVAYSSNGWRELGSKSRPSKNGFSTFSLNQPFLSLSKV